MKIPGAEQATLVFGVVGEEAAALLNIEDVGEYIAEAGESGFPPFALTGGYHQIVVGGAPLGH